MTPLARATNRARRTIRIGLSGGFCTVADRSGSAIRHLPGVQQSSLPARSPSRPWTRIVTKNANLARALA
ncbi:protein of unknown function [Methylorubrum extorquens DM4]|uniref:Uncharacterized protein n=1 Tax=Methylorubrum extorquens (strain DSM 6343 / CIP 106787 / DM4) TaxID=661410 RepID=C7C7Y4_METED|nr:protein of unknown function [Methylorubrum extorquens DM4]